MSFSVSDDDDDSFILWSTWPPQQQLELDDSDSESESEVGDGAPIQGLALERAFPGFNYAVLLNVPQESSPRPP